MSRTESLSVELRDLLRLTSRSFYLSLVILPQPVRTPLALAYLLARAADTIADSPLIPVMLRRESLAEFCLAIRSGSLTARLVSSLVTVENSSGEGRLLRALDRVLAALARLGCDDRQRVSRVLQVILAGMESDLLRFGALAPGEVAALESEAELELYTYQVAGVVGEFWTTTHAAHLPRMARQPAEMQQLGITFGCGLQLVNILRDLRQDLANGRCYLPRRCLAELGLVPEQLLSPQIWPRLVPFYRRMLLRAHCALTAGRRYMNLVPRALLGSHLACRWPLELGVATLRKLAHANPLQAPIVKVPRRTVYRMMVGSLGRALLGSTR